jgi:DNA-binding CsgD family transcriptional regulator
MRLWGALEAAMVRVDRLKYATAEVLSAALLGQSWEQALASFASASGGHGAVLMRNRTDRTLAAICSEDIAEVVDAFIAGKAPPSSRHLRVSRNSRGFRIDHDDYSADELKADPYYQEFLRPAGFFWHANISLSSGHDEWIELGLKRRFRAGPFGAADVASLNLVLPELRTAARLAARSLDAQAAGVSDVLSGRGDPVYQIDALGRVVATEVIDVRNDSDPIYVLGRKLIARERTVQAELDRAIAFAVAKPGAATLVALTPSNVARYFLQIVPVPGRARDIFLSAPAVAVLIDVSKPAPRRWAESTIARALGLTAREASVACLLALGLSPAETAARLQMQPGTVRVHLRTIFEKTGTRRQAELVALLARLQI